mmetsp:Transcript_47398/g.34687  ORF Transcript_47398/g.34687 Transcript_47398/m.34687 type:complete len:92 (-) Transcript_47398:709-984(-)
MDDCFDALDATGKVICCSVTSFIVLVTVCLIFSFGAVEPTEYGIVHNFITKQIDKDHIYEGGLQFIGVFNTLITYPRIQVLTEFGTSADAT